MASRRRRATTPSTSSEDSVPIVKRRRGPTPTEAEYSVDRSTPPPSLSQSLNGNNPSQLEEAQADSHEQAVPHEAEHAIVMDVSKQHFTLNVLPNTIITFECTKDLSVHYKVHLDVLCKQSQYQFDIFLNAQGLYESYVKVKALRKRSQAIYPLLEIHYIVPGGGGRAKAMELILQCLSAFPMPVYQAVVTQKLINATDVMFQRNDMFVEKPSKKFDRSQYPPKDVLTRLDQLRDEAVYTVLERLNMCLQQIKPLERYKASETLQKAAAQRRISLPNEDASTVKALVAWLYNGTISYTDVDHLYKIHALAHELGVTNLYNHCVNLLSTAMSRNLGIAKSEGTSLKDLLMGSARDADQARTPDGARSTDPLSSRNVVGELFKVALNTVDPPTWLQDLVADAIADSADSNLYHMLLPKMNLEMLGKVGAAMMGRKAEARDQTAVGTTQEGLRSDSGNPRGHYIKSEIDGKGSSLE